ncbi:MAG: GNAT family N-acetyltransferase, partial [Clostridia bacterium]|nr:GNAT family N-acetyltransferase [Clostridia bacterium]
VILLVHRAHHSAYLGSIFLDSDKQARGLGAEIWRGIEAMYPDIEQWRAETPMFSRRNHNFYVNKCGFHVVKIENPRDIENGSFALLKKREWSE